MKGEKMKKVLIPLAVFMAVVLIFTGCGGDTTTTTSSTQPGATTTTTSKTTTSTSITTVKPMETTSTTPTPVSSIKRGGILQYIYPYSPTTTPGWPADTANFQKIWMNFLVFEPLVKPSIDWKPIPWLAESWEWGPDKQYITFNLRQGVKYHDGSTFKAENVKFQGDIMKAQGGATGQFWDRWEIIDDYTIRLHLIQYRTDFWGALWSIGMAFPSVEAYKAHGGENGGEEWCKENPIGTGPFTFEYFELDVTMKLRAFDDYWQEGKPYLDGIDMITIKETLTAQSAMQAGEGDVWGLQQGKTLYDMKNLGFNVVHEFGGTDFLLFDTANEGAVTNDVKIRMAIEYAIDKQSMCDALGYGYLVPTNQWSPPYNPSFNADLPSRDYNPEMAKQLLTEAGYPNGVKLNIITIGSEPEILSIQQYLEDVGFDVELESVDNAKFWNYALAGWNGMINVGYAIGSDSFPASLNSYFGPNRTFNKSMVLPDEVLAKIDGALTEQDPVKAKALSDEIITDLYNHCWLVPLYSNAMGSILHPDVKDSGINTFADWSFWSPEICWLDR